MKETRKLTPLEVVDRLRTWLDEKIGDVAEDDWLLLDDFEKHIDAVRREWSMLSRISVANPEVRKGLEGRCDENLVGVQETLAEIVATWLQRK